MDVLAVCTLPHVDGYARDDIKMAMAFDIGSSSDYSALAARWASFFNTVQATGTAVCEWINASRTRAAGGCYVDVFDLTGHLDGSPHGSAVDHSTFTLGAAASAISLPNEVACAVSFRAVGHASALELGSIEAIPTPQAAQNMGAPATHSGRAHPRARRRGRFYVGPLTISTVTDTDTDKRPRLKDIFRNTVGQAGGTLTQDAPTVHPSIWSRRDEVLRHISGGVIVDDAFDTQRRRGEKAIVRGTYS